MNSVSWPAWVRKRGAARFVRWKEWYLGFEVSNASSPRQLSTPAFETERPHELKAQLVRAAIEGTEAAWSVNRRTRIVNTDPLINVVHNPARPEEFEVAEYYRLLMFQAWDMLAGWRRPDLGGGERYLDIIGANYYPNNQWLCGETSFHPERWLEVSDPQYRPLSSVLLEVYERYRRPIFIAETCTESQARADWLCYVGNEVCGALKLGVPLEGVCLYPIVDFPGWGMTGTTKPAPGVRLMLKATERYIDH